jgi:uncharacterized protein RhaS with RHS repeats
MQQRYYDPIAGRFLSVDPVTTDTKTGRSFNRYVYAQNNPYRYTDPDGREALSAQERYEVSAQILYSGVSARVGSQMATTLLEERGTGTSSLDFEPNDGFSKNKKPPPKPKTGKNDPHIDQAAKERAKRELEEAKKERERLRAIPNKSPDDKKKEEEAEQRVKHLQRKADATGETHHRGTRR